MKICQTNNYFSEFLHIVQSYIYILIEANDTYIFCNGRRIFDWATGNLWISPCLIFLVN